MGGAQDILVLHEVYIEHQNSLTRTAVKLSPKKEFAFFQTYLRLFGLNRDLQHQVFHGKPQFAVTRLQFHVAEISNFSKAFSSVQFSSFLFSQNIIQYKNTYRNCKVARSPEETRRLMKPGLPSHKETLKSKMK